MKKSLIVFIIALIVLILLIIFISKNKQENNLQIKQVCFNSTCINVELAITPAEQAKGLMFRENLSGGMLFVYDSTGEKTFWMKNTLIPLDIIWIDSNLEITAIEQAYPCTSSCQTYSHPGKYVLEVNQNFTTENNISIKEKVVIGIYVLHIINT